MRIKKKHYNEYAVLDDGIWVRNFNLLESPPVDQNEHTCSPSDLVLYLENETENYKLRLSQISSEQIKCENIIIVSDGYDFVKKQEAIMNCPRNTIIIGTNNVLNYWPSGRRSRPISYYVVNNPYADCMRFLPRESTYFPPCIASVRTHATFVKQYANKGGIVYLYSPVPMKQYSGIKNSAGRYVVDDYRNCICASVSLAYRFGAAKILLFCHDECFDNERPAAVKVENNLWTYPQQQMANNIIDAHLGWFKGTNTKIGYHATGLKLKNATYIPLDQVSGFFN